MNVTTREISETTGQAHEKVKADVYRGRLDKSDLRDVVRYCMSYKLREICEHFEEEQ